MKFLCIPCDEVMAFGERQLPGDGTLTAVFKCPACEREMAMLTNPMETQLVSSLGVVIGGRTVPEQPMQQTLMGLESPREDVMEASVEPTAQGPVLWSAEATTRLGAVPKFVRGMVKRIYSDYATENGIREITPDVMDRARSDLGLEGM